MITSRGAYTRTMQPLLSSNATAAYLGNTLAMVDCIPSSICACSWPTGLQSTSVYVHVPWRMTPSPAAECRIFMLLGLQGIPDGVMVELYGGATAAPATMLMQTETVQLPDGSIGAIIVRAAGDGWTHEYFAWRIYNSGPSGTFIAGGALFGIGEVYASPAWEWPIGRWDVKVVLPQLLNRTATGAAKKVKRDPYRTVDLTITSQDWNAAMLGRDSLMAMIYDLAAQDCIALIPRPRRRGIAAIDNDVVPESAMLADLTEAGSLGADAAVDHYPLNLQFEQFL
jgi:hypothetical protein